MTSMQALIIIEPPSIQSSILILITVKSLVKTVLLRKCKYQYSEIHRFKYFDHMYLPIIHVRTSRSSSLQVPLVALLASNCTILTKNHQLALLKEWITFVSFLHWSSELQYKNFTIHNLYFSRNLSNASHIALQDYNFNFILSVYTSWT